MSGTVSLPVFENQCLTLLCEWCSRNDTNPCHDLTAALLWAGNNFPAALCPHLFQLQEWWRVEGHPGWSQWCLSPQTAWKSLSLAQTIAQRWRFGSEKVQVDSPWWPPALPSAMPGWRVLGKGWGSHPCALGQCLGYLGRGRWCCSFHSSNGPGNAVFLLYFPNHHRSWEASKATLPWGHQFGLTGGFGSFYLDFFFFQTFFKSWRFVCLFVDLDLLGKSIWWYL